MEEKYMCKKCGCEMKKSGPYLSRKGEGDIAHKGLSLTSYCCMNEKCDAFYKNIEKLE